MKQPIFSIPIFFRRLLFITIGLLALSQLITAPIALILGFLFTLFHGNPIAKQNGTLVKQLLKIAIIGLGFGMNINQMLTVGKDGFLLTLFTIISTFLIGFLLMKLFKLDQKIAYLITTGTAICGGSAIAAIAPIIKANEKEISIALGVIFILNSVALLIFPPIGLALGLSEYQFGLWSAIAIHDTSSVVGAAMEYGEETLEVATTVKLSRALWIIPLALITAVFSKEKGKKITIPYFIFLFILAAVINSYFNLPVELTYGINFISKSLLILTLFLVGAGLSLQKLRQAGVNPLIAGVLLWFSIASISLMAIINF